MAEAELKEKVMHIARELGFDDIRFTENPMGGDMRSAAFLVKRYTPADGHAESGRIALSEYYPASQFGHENAHIFTERIKHEFGLEAEMTNAFSYKELIVKTGGTIGLNSLYYHPEFGSFISMRCVLIGAEIEPDRQTADKNLCGNCKRCISACPTEAITEAGFNRDKCLRNMMSEGLPKDARKKVYQLLGCERCQLGCPMNPQTQKEPTTLDLLEVLRGNETKRLKALCGKNMATRTRLLTQGMAFAAGTGLKAALPEIERLTDDDSDRIRDIAVWAEKELK